MSLVPLTPELLIRAYCSGIFPMSESRDDPDIFWVDPKERGILPLNDFHVPRSLRKVVRRAPFEIRCNTVCRDVIEACAQPRPGHPDTWINDSILDAYGRLHDMGVVHSVESWLDGELVGGLYGVALGGAFCGESMFSHATDASKVALVHLVARLRIGGFVLLDTQFVNEHLLQFGCMEIPAWEYLDRLQDALALDCTFPTNPPSDVLADALAVVISG